MRYHVRSPSGEELVVSSLDVLHTLYSQGFLSDEDLVRADSSDRWVRAGSMDALQGVREKRADPKRMGLVLAAVVALAAAVGIMLAR
jgi:hypothetical protein